MKKQARDPVREDRIHNEAIADANGPEEQVMGWHCDRPQRSSQAIAAAGDGEPR
jgi:hypothetical protein